MNDSIFFFFYNLAHQNAFFDKLIVFLAVYFPYIVIGLAGIFLLMHHEVFKAESPYQIFLEKKKEILKAFFSGTLAWILAYILKFLFATPRPWLALSYLQASWQSVNPLFTESGYAFPSGHATFFSALAISIFFFHKKAGYVFLFFALIISLARVIAGVHFPIDILGGFALGILVAYFVKKI